MVPKYHRLVILNSSGQTAAIGAMVAVAKGQKKTASPDPRVVYSDDIAVGNAGTIANAAYGNLTTVQNTGDWDAYDYTCVFTAHASASGTISLYLQFSNDGTIWPDNDQSYLLAVVAVGNATVEKFNLTVDRELTQANYYKMVEQLVQLTAINADVP